MRGDDFFAAAQLEEIKTALQMEKKNSQTLQENLSRKEAELLATEDKYKKSVDKAKEVIRMLDPRAIGIIKISSFLAR
jgi:protein HOOK3